MKKSGFTSGCGGNGGSSGGESWTEESWGTYGLYRKPTQAGFDGFFSLSRYPEWDGVLYPAVTGWEVKYTTTNVTDGSSFDTAWAATSTFDSAGALDGSITTDIGQDYWHWTPGSLSDGTYQQLVKFCVMTADRSAYTILWWYSYRVALDTFSAPSVTVNTTTNTFNITNVYTGSRRIVEFKRKDSYTPYSAYLTSEETDIAYNCIVRNQERGIWSGQAIQVDKFNIWADGTYKVKLTYHSSHPSGTRTRFSDAVDNWISIMNSAISGSGVSFTRDDSAVSPDILVRTRTNAQMGNTSTIDPITGYPSGSTVAGTWSTDVNANGYIYYADVNILYEIEYYDTFWASVESIITEELTESCGCGGDLTTRADCINTDWNWYGKSDGNFNSIDEHIQTFMYTSGIQAYVNANAEKLAVLMNPSNGACFTITDFYDFKYLEAGEEYYYRIWEVQSNQSYSIVPTYSSYFTVGQYGGMKVYTSGAWRRKPVKRWNGSSWAIEPGKVYNNGAWRGY